MILNILEQFDLSSLEANSVERVHLEAEASKIAFHHRNKYLEILNLQYSIRTNAYLKNIQKS